MRCGHQLVRRRCIHTRRMFFVTNATPLSSHVSLIRCHPAITETISRLPSTRWYRLSFIAFHIVDQMDTTTTRGDASHIASRHPGSRRLPPRACVCGRQRITCTRQASVMFGQARYHRMRPPCSRAIVRVLSHPNRNKKTRTSPLVLTFRHTVDDGIMLLAGMGEWYQ